ncbi:hypothetical protein TNCT_138601 [Trichonephila clavata]|uniref:Uncharacterized protein n=1 Tax=Trichonephila clavata TaxID=2740835 RepID=A0A8X6ISM9_TRICU|nr:hypothetical protein TNCT_138601 [Trichonephila clavata]
MGKRRYFYSAFKNFYRNGACTQDNGRLIVYPTSRKIPDDKKKNYTYISVTKCYRNKNLKKLTEKKKNPSPAPRNTMGSLEENEIQKEGKKRKTSW